MEQSPKLPEAFLKSYPWKEAKSSIWPASVFILRRNVNPYPFPHRLKEGDALTIKSLLEKALAPFLDNPIFLSKDTITPLEKEFLFEHFILSEGYEKFDAGKGLVVDNSGLVLGLINVEDHLHLHLYNTDRNLSEAYTKISTLEKEMSKTIPFSFSERFGYLTSDPHYAGTGLTVQAFLHLPLLIQLKRFPEIQDKLSSDVIIRGLGKENEYLADLALLENKNTLGVCEKSTLEAIVKNATFLEEEEKKLEALLSEEDKNLLKDKVSRSFGLLSYAHSLHAHEALASLSLIELGRRLHWIDGEFTFHEHFFSLRRAHLLSSPCLSTQINEERAKLSTNLLSKLKLTY